MIGRAAWPPEPLPANKAIAGRACPKTGTFPLLLRFQLRETRALAVRARQCEKGLAMLKWILILLIVAAVAGLFGMPRLAGMAASLAQILIFVVLIVLAAALLFGVIAVV